MIHHILVVDDDPGIRDVLAAVLDEEGFIVATAGNGAEALACIAASRPVLVLLDLQMPVLTGWEVLTHLRNAQVDVPVVLMTAGSRAKSEAKKHQADGYVAKPFDRFNYLVAITTKWWRHYFYFTATYAVPGPTALVPSFEDPFARLEYVGGDRFHLAFRRHTGEWITVYRDLPLADCFTSITTDPRVIP